MAQLLVPGSNARTLSPRYTPAGRSSELSSTFPEAAERLPEGALARELLPFGGTDQPILQAHVPYIPIAEQPLPILLVSRSRARDRRQRDASRQQRQQFAARELEWSCHDVDFPAAVAWLNMQGMSRSTRGSSCAFALAAAMRNRRPARGINGDAHGLRSGPFFDVEFSSVCFTTAIPAVIISSTCALSSSGSRSAVQTKCEPPLMSGSTHAAPL